MQNAPTAKKISRRNFTPFSMRTKTAQAPIAEIILIF